MLNMVWGTEIRLRALWGENLAGCVSVLLVDLFRAVVVTGDGQNFMSVSLSRMSNFFNLHSKGTLPTIFNIQAYNFLVILDY